MKGILICTYFSYADPLIQAYTLPYVKIIRKFIDPKYPVFLLTIEKPKHRLSRTETKIQVERLAVDRIFWLSMPYVRPGLSMLAMLPGFIRALSTACRSDVGMIHGWCTPGGVVGLILSILCNKMLILDSFEPHAEAMLETGTWSKTSLRFRLLFYLERLMARHSTVQICCTSSMFRYAREKYQVTLSRPYIKPACVDTSRFSLGVRKNKNLMNDLDFNGKLVCVYAGKFGGLYLKDEFFDFIRVARDIVGDNFRLLLLSEESASNVQAWFNDFDIPLQVLKHVYVPHHEVPIWAGLADFAIAPYFPAPSRRHSAPIKVSEYWALGLPTIITRDIAEDSSIIKERKLGSVLTNLSDKAYENSVLEILNLFASEDRFSLSQRIASVAKELKGFDRAEVVYRSIFHAN